MPNAPVHICHLTVLNPARHSRIFYKEAVSQVEAGFSVTVVGQDRAEAPYREVGVQVVPMGTFGRLSWRRLMARTRLLNLARLVAADIYIIHSPELFGVARQLRLDHPEVKLVYDMHEDYPANIRAGAGYYPWIREALASWVERQTHEFSGYGDGIWYAEECYPQLSGVSGLLLRNRFRKPDHLNPSRPGRPRLLYTGTLAENWGIHRSMALWRALNRLGPVDLVVAGHGQDPRWPGKLTAQAKEWGLESRFRFVGNGGYLDHRVILGEVAECTAGLALYELAPNLSQKIPTKFYEFMGMGKPLLFSANPYWEELNKGWGMGIPVDFPADDRQLEGLYRWLTEQNGPSEPIAPQIWAWQPEADRMVEFLKGLT